jgi:hypothetical protein
MRKMPLVDYLHNGWIIRVQPDGSKIFARDVVHVLWFALQEQEFYRVVSCE